MKNILDFCYSKINYIQDKLDMYNIRGNTKLEFFIPYEEGGRLNFSFAGSGTYGNVLRVINMTDETTLIPKNESFIMKIMKVKHDEPERCMKIKRVIKKIKLKKKEIALQKMKLDLIEKYTTQIIDVKKGKRHDVIFLEYIKGYDLKDFIMEKDLTDEDIAFIYLQCLISVRIFHKILRFSHRDLKLENLYYNQNTKYIQVLDYSFVCDRDDRDCYEKNQGTAKYIHLKMNKITTKKYNRYQNNSNNSSLSPRSNNRSRKRNYNFPESFSQDLFSLIIILFKLYYENTRKILKYQSIQDRKVFSIIEKFNDSFKKHKNKYREKKTRYKLKNSLFKKLLALDSEDIKTSSINVVVNIIRKYWDFKKRDFVYEGKTGDIIASNIIDEMIDSLINITKLARDKNSTSDNIICDSIRKKEILEDIGKLKLINN
jgi:hypothetical protein